MSDDVTSSALSNEGACPFEIERPIMMQRWERLTFLHWSFDPETVQRLLPPSLTVQTFDGRAWVALVPFFMRVGRPGAAEPVRGSLPWVTRFCETNVRTYVRDAEGREGIWFFSLEASRLGVVATARTTYRLPYMWSAMSLELDGSDTRPGSSLRYRSRRRWPGPRGASSDVTVDIGEPYGPGELSPFEHFLTARWILFSRAGDHHRFARAAHAPWVLHHATARAVNDGLLEAAGLPSPVGTPLVHYSPGVDVRIGRPERSGWR
jgi:uncharacterized protein YqjF (DUF2071 family)